MENTEDRTQLLENTEDRKQALEKENTEAKKPTLEITYEGQDTIIREYMCRTGHNH